MYPKNYFDLFPAFPRENSVFVAMSFAPQFQSRYDNVIKPAIESVDHEGSRLEPIRVDAKKISDSVLTEILTGIGNSKLIFADITSLIEINNRPYRNENVMYEIGIATAMRLPEEVILFRSDQEQLSFDIANIRVNSYAPDENIADATESVTAAIREAISETDLKKNLAVKNAISQLDEVSLRVMRLAQKEGFALSAIDSKDKKIPFHSYCLSINKLLELGALTTEFIDLSEGDNVQKPALIHKLTSFGHELVLGIVIQSNITDPMVVKKLSDLGHDMTSVVACSPFSDPYVMRV